MHSMGFKAIEFDTKLELKITPESKYITHGINSFIGRNLSNMEMNDTDIFEESHIWTDQEIQQLLSIIDEMNLANDLAPEKFSPTAIKLIKNGLLMAGYCKTLEQIEIMLLSLKMAYFKNRKELVHGIDINMNPYYDTLERIWNSCIISKSNEEKIDQSLHGKILNQKSPSWSQDETMELLNLIDEMNLTSDFRHRLSPSTIKNLVVPLANRGYVRTCSQIIGRMRSMRDNYLRCVRTGRASQVINNWPFFDKIDKMFQRLLVNNDLSLLHPIDHDYGNKFEISIGPLDTKTEELNESDLSWQPIQSPTEDGETLFQSVESPLNDKRNQSCIEEKFGVNKVEDIKSNISNTNSLDIGSNLETYSNLANDWQTAETKNNESYSLRSHINGGRKKLKTRMFSMNTPKYIRIVKGNSKYIMRKKDPPPYMKSEPMKRKRPHSQIEESNDGTNELSPSDDGDKPPPPIRITMTKKLRDETVPRINSPMQENSTCSQTESVNNDFQLSETMVTLMKQILNHQEQMQQQHHKWMEKQFQIQRAHDYEQRQLLLDELREFRKELRDVTEQLFTD